MKDLREFSLAEPRLRLDYQPLQQSLPTIKQAIRYFAEHLSTLPFEEVIAIYCDCQINPRFYTIISRGTETQSPFSIKSILSPALLSEVSNIILLHNHPSGNSHPSKNDLLVTYKAQECLHYFELNLLDSIIVPAGNPKGFYSIMLDHTHDSPWKKFLLEHRK